MPHAASSWQVSRDRVLDRGQVASIWRVVDVWRARDGADAVFARLFAFLIVVPLRLSEALAIRRADVHADRDQAYVRIRRLKKRKPTFADIPLSKVAFVACQATTDRVFPADKFSAIRSWHRLCAEAQVVLPANCAVHILRHTAATELLRATKNLRLVQDILGHSSPAQTAGYTHVAFDDVADALNLIGAR